MVSNSKAVAECPSKDCALWTYRLGTNPKVSEETRAARRINARSHNLGVKRKHANAVGQS